MINSSIADSLQQLDSLIQQGKWSEARAASEMLVQRAATSPGVIERAVLVLRQLNDWHELITLLLQARNRYKLWPLGSDLLMGQAMVETEQWDQSIPYLQLALDQGVDGGGPIIFYKALRHSGQLEQALEHQRLAAEQLPEFAWAPFEAAQVLIELEQPRMAILELQEARRRHGELNVVIEDQWQKLQPLVLLLRVEQLQAEGSNADALAVLRQAMLQIPEDEALNAKLIELLLSQSSSVTHSDNDHEVDVFAMEKELKKIESMLDLLEA